MNFNDFISRLKKGKALFNTVTVGIILLGVLISFLTWFGWVVVVLGVTINLIVNSLQVIPPGYAGCLVILGDVKQESVDSGLHFLYPYISYYKVCNVQLQVHKDTNVVKDKNSNEVTLAYTLKYKINNLYTHLLYEHVGEGNIVANILCPDLDDVMTSIINKETYESVNEDKDAIKEKIINKFHALLHDELSSIGCGRIFKYSSLSVTEIKYEPEVEKVIRQVAEVKKREELVVETAKQKKLIAENEAETLKIRAEAEAEAMRIKGATENEIKERLGEILKNNPELIKEVAAKNLPKVWGGTSMINLDNIFGDGK